MTLRWTKDSFDKPFRQTPHYGQLIVPMWQLKEEARCTGRNFAYDLLRCIAGGPDDPGYKMTLLSASSRLYHLSRLVYKSKNGFSKLSEEEYEKCLFEAYMENRDEVAGRLVSICEDIKAADADVVFRCVEGIKPLAVRWVSCLKEQLYVYEFAALIDYAIRRKGNVPCPEAGLFPANFEGFSCSEGIGEEFEQYSF